ncbi:MAG: helix-turn-helix transcriptional regulator [Gammaproteobacteria bacterium]
MIGADFQDKEYRDAFVESNIRNAIAFQIRALRKKRSWSQGDLATRSGKAQNVISRLEDPDYGRYTLQTLLALAATFDVALSVRFVSYGELLSQLKNVSDEALAVPSFEDEVSVVTRAEVTSISAATAPKFAVMLDAAEVQCGRTSSYTGALTSLASTENNYKALSDETALRPLGKVNLADALRVREPARSVSAAGSGSNRPAL